MSFSSPSQYKNLRHSFCGMSSLLTFYLNCLYIFFMHFRDRKVCIQYICIFPHFIKNISIFHICDSFLTDIVICLYLSVISVLCILSFFFFTLFLKKNLKERGGISVICGWMTLDEYFKTKLQKSLRNLHNRYMFIIQCLHKKIDFSTPEVILVNII